MMDETSLWRTKKMEIKKHILGLVGGIKQLFVLQT